MLFLHWSLNSDWMWCFVVSLHLPLMKVSHGKEFPWLPLTNTLPMYQWGFGSLRFLHFAFTTVLAWMGETVKRKSFFFIFLYLLRHPCLTCGDDSNAQATWNQLSIWLLVVHAVVSLRPGHQPMHNFTEHPVTTYTHHPEKVLRHLTLDPLGHTAMETMVMLESSWTPCCAALIYSLSDNYVLTKRDL